MVLNWSKKIECISLFKAKKKEFCKGISKWIYGFNCFLKGQVR